MHGEPDDRDELTALPSVIARHDVSLPAEQVAALVRYCAALWRCNRQLNLTRHTTAEKFVTRDLVDTVQLAGLLMPGERVLDVGTGGGVPGVPLAIIRADLKISLSESVAKRSRAVEQIVKESALPVRVYHARAEDLVRKKSFDTLVARAVAPLPKLLGWFSGRWPSFGRMLIIKGPSWTAERAEARHQGLMADLELRKAAEYPLPEGDRQSVILQVRRKINRET